jgi:hypothetical protein
MGGCFTRQLFVLDSFAKPSRIVACLPMMFPTAITNAGRRLEKHSQIVRSEIKRVAGAAEIEAAVRTKAPLGVFAGMSVVLLPRAIEAYGARVSGHGVIEALVVVGLWQGRRNGSSNSLAVRCDHLACFDLINQLNDDAPPTSFEHEIDDVLEGGLCVSNSRGATAGL